MYRRLLVPAGIAAGVMLWATPAVAAPPAPPVPAVPVTVTATGTQLVRVLPSNRKLSSSIQAAVQAAQKAGIPGALAVAQAQAANYANAAGLTLGTLVSISDIQANENFLGGPYSDGPFQGPFGLNQYCGVERRPVFRTVDGKRKVVRTRKVHTCIVPRYEATTLTVTYTAH